MGAVKNAFHDEISGYCPECGSRCQCGDTDAQSLGCSVDAEADGQPVPQVALPTNAHAAQTAVVDQSREGTWPAEVSAEHALPAEDRGAATPEVAPEHEGTILDPRVWNNPKLAYIYLLADRLVETFPEDSPEEDALRLAMSKIDEADMIVAMRASVGRSAERQDREDGLGPKDEHAVDAEGSETPNG